MMSLNKEDLGQAVNRSTQPTVRELTGMHVQTLSL